MADRPTSPACSPDVPTTQGLFGKPELANTTAGLMLGFFGRGTQLQIHLDQDKWHPVHIDLHHCVEQNTELFQMAWASTMYAFAQKASGADSMQSTGLDTTKVGRVWEKLHRLSLRC